MVCTATVESRDESVVSGEARAVEKAREAVVVCGNDRARTESELVRREWLYVWVCGSGRRGRGRGWRKKCVKLACADGSLAEWLRR